MDNDRPAIRLLPAQEPARLAPLDDCAERVVQAVAQGENLVVLGSAGSGKTNLALTLLARAVEAGREALLLAPTRVRADALRAMAAHVTAGAGAGKVRVRTPASYAFSVVAASHAGRPDPLPAPVLLMGATEDATLAELVDPRAWAPLPPEAVSTPAFRTQLRNLLARCGELGIDGEELARLGQVHGIEIWQQAASLVAAWDAQGRPQAHNRAQVRKMDSVRIQDRAVEALESWKVDGVAGEPPIPELIIVDDYQDCTNATARMLGELATPGRDGRATQVVVLGNPDVAVETFRGGAPSLLVEAQRQHTLDAHCMILTHCHRGTPALREVWADQEQRVPVTGIVDYRLRALEAGGTPVISEEESEGAALGVPGAPEGVTAFVASNAEQEISHIARILRAEHVHEGTPWEHMAVIVRSSSMARAMVRELRRRGVPVDASRPAVLLRTEPAAAALLAAARDALAGRYGSGEEPAQDSAILALLHSPLVGLSELDLRRVRRRLRAGAQGAQGEQGAQAPSWLAEGTGIPDLVASEELAGRFEELVARESVSAQAHSLRRAAHIVAAARAVVDAASEEELVDCEELLWAIWQASERAEQWRAQALAPVAVTSPSTAMMAEAAENHLDVVTALFKRAEVWAERHPGSGAQAFLDELFGELLPSDSVAPHGVRPPGVAVRTAASAAGAEWDVVVVAGLQRDTWPDLRVRDSLTRAGLLVDIAGGAQGDDSVSASAIHERSREQVRADERRMFVGAISRARRRLILCAYATGDDQPSVFFFEACTSAGVEVLDRQGQVLRIPDTGDFTLRGLVGQLRHALVRGQLPSASPTERERAQAAAALLARMAREGIPGALPAQWQDISIKVSGIPLVEADVPVRVSPSDVEALVTCPLRWFLERQGGSTAPSQAQQVGTTLHRLAEEGQLNGRKGAHVRDNLEVLIEQMEFPDTTLGHTQAQRLREVGERLAAYLDSVPGEVLVEAAVDTVLEIRPDPPAREAESQDSDDRGGNPPATETDEDLGIELVRIRGRIDRLELLEPGSGTDGAVDDGERSGAQARPARIIDLKTGKSAYANASRNPQLATYRLALEASGQPVDGAALVLLGQDPPKKNMGLPVLSPSGAALDPSPDEEGRHWDLNLLFDAARSARGPLFEARWNSKCRFCQVKDCCPLQVSGRSAVL